MKRVHALKWMVLIVIAVACNKSPNAGPGPNPAPPPTPPAVAKLITLPAGWKFDINLSNGFPEGIEAYTFDTLFRDAKIKAFAVAFNPKISYLEFKPTLSTTSKKPSEFYAQETGIVYACMNGGYFGGNQSYSLIKYNTVLSPNIKSVNRTYNGSSTPYYPTRAAFGISSTGDPSTVWMYNIGTGNDRVYQYPAPAANLIGAAPQPIPDEAFPAGGTEWSPPYAVGGSPMLLKGGEVRITDKEELIDINNTTSRPRSAIGYTAGGIVILLTVEGDNTANGYPGINLANLALFLKELGCTNAINLDGGGSTSMIINNRATVRPGDNGVERSVPSVVLIKRK
ncbi:MAG: phosphodiester glycosidase family protein [Bacteroidetes bacterium]|nr:phosphodiester glycosidase family protein [Bacteroidota bacterium]